MSLPLRDALVPKLRAAFSRELMRVGGETEALVVFPAKHPEIGDLVIQDEGDELTVIVGNITHRHFASQSPGSSAEIQAEQLATEVTEYLRQLFADEIEFYGDGSHSGARARSEKERGLLSKLLLGKRTYLWSGPVER